MQVFFATLGLHNPELASELPEHMTYPLSQRTQGALDLDYTPLLLGDGFSIDSNVLQYVVESESAYLEPMAYTLRRLLDEGLLNPVDMGSIICARKDALSEKVTLLLKDPIPWLHLIRKHWRLVFPEFKEFHHTFGRPEMRQINEGHPGVDSWLAATGRSDEVELRKELMALFRTSRDPTDEEMPEVVGSMRFVLAQILMTDLIRHQLRLPFIDWSDAEPYYERLYASRWDGLDNEFHMQRQARKLFDVVIPELKPLNIDQVIRFIRDDRAVSSMRSELFDLFKRGEEVSREWFAEYVNKAFARELAAKKKIRRVKWLGAATGLLLPGASLAQELASEALQYVGESRIDKPGNYLWYYTLHEALREP